MRYRDFYINKCKIKTLFVGCLMFKLRSRCWRVKIHRQTIVCWDGMRKWWQKSGIDIVLCVNRWLRVRTVVYTELYCHRMLWSIGRIPSCLCRDITVTLLISYTSVLCHYNAYFSFEIRIGQTYILRNEKFCMWDHFCCNFPPLNFPEK